MAGLIRGVLSPPEVALPTTEPQTSRGPRPSLGEAWRALLLGAGSVAEDRFWSEEWTSNERVLTDLDRLAEKIARRRPDRHRRGLVARSRRVDPGRPLVVARPARARRRARRRQEPAAHQHPPQTDQFWRVELDCARHRAARWSGGGTGAALAAGRRRGGTAGGLWRSRSPHTGSRKPPPSSAAASPRSPSAAA